MSKMKKKVVKKNFKIELVQLQMGKQTLSKLWE